MVNYSFFHHIRRQNNKNERLNMTIAVDWDVKPQNNQPKTKNKKQPKFQDSC